MCRSLLVTSLLLMVGLSTQRASAAAGEGHHELSNTHWKALTLESVGAAASLTSAWLLTGGPRKTCRWCESNGFDEAMRSTLKADEPRAPALISHGLSVVAIPTLTLTGLIIPAYRDGATERGLEDSWIVANTFLITTALGDFTKHLVARRRPTFHHGTEQETEFSSYPNERNKSFFSLDTAWAFAIVSSGATLSYLRGYSSANYVAVAGGAMAVGAGTLRIVADAHWTTDVLTGAAIGTLVGIAVPTLLHGRQPKETAATAQTPLTRATTVTLSFAF